MGGACCKNEVAPEFNPDGTQKDEQTKDQIVNDPLDLRKAAREGDLELVKQLLRRMPVKQINAKANGKEAQPEDAGHTALHFAARAGDIQMLKNLLLYGSEPNMPNSEKKTALLLAIEAGKKKTVKYLFEKGRCDHRAKDNLGNGVMLTALLTEKKSMLVTVLDHISPLDLSETNRARMSVAALTAKYGWFDILSRLMDMSDAQETPPAEDDKPAQPPPQLDVATVSNTGDSVLGWMLKYACQAWGMELFVAPVPSFPALLERVLKMGAKAGTCVFAKVPPAAIAAQVNVDTLNTLIGAGATVSEVSDNKKRNPLHYAAGHGCSETVAMLLEQGLSPAAVDADKNTPLHYASMGGHIDVVTLLLEKADKETTIAALGEKNKAGLTPYHIALKAGGSAGAQAVVKKMIGVFGDDAEKLHMCTTSKEADTPLMLAISSHQDTVVEELLAKGGSAVAPNAKGELPLDRNFRSVTAGSFEADASIFNQLLAAGASFEAPPGGVHPAVSLCTSGVSEFTVKAVAVVKEKGVSIDWLGLTDAEGTNTLHLAARSNDGWMVRFLIDEMGIAVDSPMPGSGMTPVMYAAQASSVHAMKVLLNRGTDVNATDVMGKSVLSYCLDNDRLNSLVVATMLLQRGAKAEDCVDKLGEGLLLRAVRYGDVEFIQDWASFGGNLMLQCSTPLPDPKAKKEKEPQPPPPEEEAVCKFDAFDGEPDPLEADDDDDEEEEEEDVEGEGDQGQDEDGEPVAEGFYCTHGHFDRFLKDEINPLDLRPRADEDLMDMLARVGKTIDANDLFREHEAMLGLYEPSLWGANPVAESKEDGKTDLSIRGAASSMSKSLMKRPKEITDPYFKDDSLYSELPKYFNVDCELPNMESLREAADRAKCRHEKARPGTAKDDGFLEGQQLMDRNLRNWISTFSPEERPLKPNQFRRIIKYWASVRRAQAKGRKVPKARGVAAKGIELNGTNALIYAVRLCRIECCKMLLKVGLGLLDMKDGFNHAPVEYAMMAVAQNKTNKAAQLMADLILSKLPDPNTGCSLMNPMVLAACANDMDALCHLVLNCGGKLDAANVSLGDIPVYLQGQWDNMVKKQKTFAGPLHCTVLAKRLDSVKIALVLGADINRCAMPPDAAQFIAKRKAEIEQAKAEAGKHLGFFAKMMKMVKMLPKMLPSFGNPHGYVTPLGLAARFGLSDVTMLLIKHGALVAGFPFAPKTPVQEALAFARKNMKYVHLADTTNFDAFREDTVDQIPSMSEEALAQEAQAKMMAIMSMFNPQEMAIKAAVLVAKTAVKIIMAMRKRPVAHYDPGLATAHILIHYGAPLSPSEDSQTEILLRNLFDTGCTQWVQGGLTLEESWVKEAVEVLEKNEKEELTKEAMFKAMSEAKEPKAYKKTRRKFIGMCERTFFKIGMKHFMQKYSPIMESKSKAQENTIKEWAAKQAEHQANKEGLEKRFAELQKQMKEAWEQREALMASAAEMASSGFEFGEDGGDLCGGDDDWTIATAMEDAVEGAKEQAQAAVDEAKGKLEEVMEDPSALQEHVDVQGLQDAAKKAAGGKSKKGKAVKKATVKRAAPTDEKKKSMIGSYVEGKVKDATKEMKAKAMDEMKSQATELLKTEVVDFENIQPADLTDMDSLTSKITLPDGAELFENAQNLMSFDPSDVAEWMKDAFIDPEQLEEMLQMAADAVEMFNDLLELCGIEL